MDLIRNFSIIAHIDHGKSTLADRLIQRCGGLDDREMSTQVLDSMDIERERGITIKAQTAALKYKAKNGKEYRLNLIDTPGFFDFAGGLSEGVRAAESVLIVTSAGSGLDVGAEKAIKAANSRKTAKMFAVTKTDEIGRAHV